MRGHIVARLTNRKYRGKPVYRFYIVYDAGTKWDEEKQKSVRDQRWEAVELSDKGRPATRADADAQLADRLTKINRGELVQVKKITFREFSDLWMEKYAAAHVRPRSLDKYRAFLDKHLLPAFGEMGLVQIGVEDVHGFKAAKLEERYSESTVKGLLALLRQMLNHAIDWDYLRTNPAKKVKDPRIPKREMDFLVPEELRGFLENAPQKWYPLFLTALTTGLRIGELLAMKWKHVDWKGSLYLVRETLTRKTKTQERGFAEPKSVGSMAPVDLTPTCLDTLKAHRKAQAAEKPEAGEGGEDLDMVFPGPTGKALDDRNFVHRAFEPALTAAGLRRIRFHDLWHTCASLMIAQGEGPKYIQRQLRHASIDITFNTYRHLFPETNRQAAKRMDESPRVIRRPF
jgi:integrase